MPNNSEHSQKSAINYPNQSQKLRTNRLLQIIGLTLFSLVLAVAVADGTTKWVLVAGCFTLALAGIFAYQRHVTAATVV